MKGPFSKTTNIETDTLNLHLDLHQAALFGKIGVTIVTDLLNKGADINAKNENGMTALHCAALLGSDAMVTHLLDKGADIEAKDKNDQTALHYAAAFGLDTKVALLLERGADIEAKDKDGETPLGYANPLKVKKYFESNDLTKTEDGLAVMSYSKELYAKAKEYSESRAKEHSESRAKEHSESRAKEHSESNNLTEITELLSRIDLNQQSLDSAKNGETKKVEELLKKGVEISESSTKPDAKPAGKEQPSTSINPNPATTTQFSTQNKAQGKG